MKKTLCFSLFINLLIIAHLSGQAPKTWKSSDIYHGLEKLNFLGSALYVAAHPDDENTRMISYLSNHVHARTGYLSLTRGDGGQNLIGPEIRELLGVIRTQELLAARSIDGGEQMFSRANDFGYSKHSDETLEIWDEDQVLSDVVWAIREFRPDIIINRFDHKSAGRTHGHHTASAVLSYEAFDMAGKSDVFTDQLRYVEAFIPRRLFFNTSWWFYGSQEKFAAADKSDMVKVDIGVYYPMMGKSNSEIAAESRSQHKCQGMGNTGSRGSQEEYLQLLKGDMPEDSGDLFAGINTTWSRIPGGSVIGEKIDGIIRNFDFTSPEAIVPSLVKIRKMIDDLPDNHWKKIKLAESDQLIEACLGLYLEVVSSEHRSVPGANTTIDFEVTNRSSVPVKLINVHIPKTDYDSVFNHDIGNNEAVTWRQEVQLSKKLAYTAPYWLMKKGSLGMYQVEDQRNIGLPESLPAISAHIKLEIAGEEIVYVKNLKYKYNSPEDGPVYRPFEITPPLFVTIPDKVHVFSQGNAKFVDAVITAGKDNVQGDIRLDLPEGWSAQPEYIPFTLALKGEEGRFTFTVSPPVKQDEAIVKAIVNCSGQKYSQEMVEINYNHIPFQSVLIPSEAKMVNLDIQIIGKSIAYIMGAGDDIPSSLSQIGYTVDLIEPEAISSASLMGYDAVIMGVRAYNKWGNLRFKQKELMEYVNNGGTMIVQYNTNRGLKVDNLGPYPLTVSRTRVAQEDAPVTILQPDHQVMHTPNKITLQDFQGWVQERGLYFPDKWDERYTPILSSHDTGEEAASGGLLVAPYGSGWYVYTGYSWFRELPAGVPGAYRIFANMIALGNTVRP